MRTTGCTLVLIFLTLLGSLMAGLGAATADASGTYDVRSFGAKGDGVTLDTPAINKAIDAASAAGGGTVRFSAGTYLSVSIHLKSDITLFLDRGATLEAASPKSGAEYDPPEPNPAGGAYQDFGHCHWHNSLIWGEGLENVSIVGPGRIWGQGLVRGDGHPDGSGNKSISLKLCRNVTLRDFTLQHGGWFGILATGVDNLTIDNLEIDTNRDGMDIDCCRNVRVSNCSVNSPNDDGICLKSSYGLGFARATENVAITNCLVCGFDEGSLLDATYRRHPLRTGTGNQPTGRIKFGTESNGGFQNIAISNCVFDYCGGLALETVDGGLLQDVTVTNLTMRDICNAPIFLRLGGRLRGPAGTSVGALRRVSISNVTVYNANSNNGCIITGIPGHAVEDVTLSNITLWYKGGVTAVPAPPDPGEMEQDYPDPGRFGVMPDYGFFLRHLHGVTLDNIQIHTLAPDSRPAFLLRDVTGLKVRDTEEVTDAQKAAGK